MLQHRSHSIFSSLLSNVSASLLVLIVAVLAVSAPGLQAQGTGLTSTEYQVTDDLHGAYGYSTPVIGHDSIGDYIVYVQYPIVNGVAGNSNIYYQRVANGQPTGSPVVVADSEQNQYLNDAYGDYIVYTRAPSVGMIGDIVLFQISTGLAHPLTGSGDCIYPRIYGNYVIWLQQLAKGTQILFYDVTTGVPVQTTLIAGPTPSVGDIAIGDRFIVWSQIVNNQYDVAAYDMQKGMLVPVSANPQLNEQHVATSGPWIAIETSSVSNPQEISIEAINMDTGVTLTVANNGKYNQRPSISGDLLSYESNILGYFQIFVFRLAEGDTFQATSSTYDERLSEIKDTMVTYVDDRTGNYNIFASRLNFYATGPAVTVSPSPVNFPKVTVGASTTQSVLLTINRDITLSNVQASGDFSVTSNSCSPLPYSASANAICTLQVQFTPSKPGQRWFPLVVTDSNSNSYRFGLEGVGVGAVAAFTPGIISTVAGTGTAGKTDNSFPRLPTTVELNFPTGVAVDSAGNFYIADAGNGLVRKVAVPGGLMTIVAGGETSGLGDGGPATSAQLLAPDGVAVDGAGNLYIADAGYMRIRKVDVNGVITTVAGNGTSGFGGDGGKGTSAELYQPQGVALDSAGNLYIDDHGNNRIRKVDVNGVITTVAGNGTQGFSGDGGPATSAELDQPLGVALDSSGNFYIADGSNRIRKVDTSGIITTVAGTGLGGYYGDYGPATSAWLGGPTGVAVDSAGNFYIAEVGNDRIRKVDISGTITTVAGTGTGGYGGDGGPATSAKLNAPFGVAVDSTGNLYIADFSNSVIRKVDVTTSALSFGSLNVGQISSPQTVAMSDVGNTPLNFSLWDSTSDFQFQAVDNNCQTMTVPLAIGATCAISVAFTPTAAGQQSGAIFVYNDSFQNPQIFGLNGVATAPPLITWAAPAPITYGTALSSTQLNATATYNGASVPGTFTYSPAAGTLLSAGTQTLSATFTSSDGTFTSVTTTVTLLVSQAEATASFTGAPASAAYGSTFTVTATTNASTTAVILPSGPCSVAGNVVTLNSGTGICTLTANWAADAKYPAMTLSQTTTETKAVTSTSITSQSPNPSTTAQTVAIYVSVTVPTGVPTGYIAVGASTGESCNATLNAGGVAGCALNFSTPGTRTVSASYAGDMNFAESSSAAATQSVTTGFLGSPITLFSGGPTNFGAVNVGTSSTQNLSVSINTELTLSNVQANGDYSLLNNSCALNAQLSANTVCLLQVRFTPSKPGQRWSPLVLTDSDSNRYSIGMEGIGVGSALAFTPGIISTMVGSDCTVTVNGRCYSGDNGPASSAELDHPSGMAVDSEGNLYIADTYNHRIRKVDSSGVITTVAGSGNTGYNGDGLSATSTELYLPSGVAVDSAGNLYIAESQSSRIRKVDVNGIVTTVAGNGNTGYYGDGILATKTSLTQPMAVTVDGAGNLYIAEYSGLRVRKVSVNGIISTVAGNGTYGSSGDNGPATTAQISGPSGVAVDSAGNLYIADYVGQRIRKVDSNGVITTAAGTGQQGYSGDGGAATSAQLSFPNGVAVDSAGNLYIADSQSNRIRKVDSSGVITTVAGNGILGSSGDAGLATNASINQPSSVAVDSEGNLYIADMQKYRIRKVDVTTSVLSFNSLNVGQTSSAQSVGVSDVGNATLNFANFSFLGAAGNFQVQGMGNGNDCVTGTPLAVGASCALGVAFAPTVEGNPLTDALKVSDDAFNGPQSVNLSGAAKQNPVAPTASFVVSALTSVKQSTAFNFTVTAQDSSNNIATGYRGTVHFTSSDPSGSVVLPADYAFTASDNGTHTFSATLITVGNQSITATDMANVSGSLNILVAGRAPVLGGHSNVALEATGPQGAMASFTVEATTWNGGAATVTCTPASGGTFPLGATQVNCTATDPASPSLTTNTQFYISVKDTTPAKLQLPTPITTIAGGTTGLPVTYTASAADVADPSPTVDCNPASGTVFPIGTTAVSCTATDHVVTDLVTGNSGGNESTGTFNVTVRGTPTITWATPGPITYGTPLGTAQLNATANVPGTFVYTPATEAVLSAGSNRLSVTFSPTDATDYTTATATVTLTVNKVTPVINWATPAPITYGTALTSSQLNATASVAGMFTYNPPAGTVLGAGTKVLSATFTPTDMADYSVASAQVTIQVKQATPVLAWTPASIQLGNALGAAQLDAAANIPGTFTYTPPLGTTILTMSQTLSALFIPNDAIDYTTASMSVPLTVTAGPLASVSPSSINFGTVYQGTISIKNVTVTNLGNAPMTISDPFLSIVSGGNSKEFVMANLCPKPLGAGKSCTIVVSFIAGPFYNPQTSTIQVKDNAPGSPQTVNLTATVINPQASFQPASLSFGTQAVNSITTKTVTLTNTGATALSITNIAITGTNAADFTQASACPSSLAAGASCTISVTFKPLSKNTFAAGLTVTDNTFSGKQTISLSGTGH